MRNYMKITAIALVLGLAAPVLADDAKPFADAKEIDLTMILPTPSTPDSAETKAELAAVLAVQAARTKDQSDRAVADDEEDVWRFADVFNSPNFTADKLPKFAAFFDRITATEGAVVDPAKEIWARPRPYMMDATIEPLLKKKTSGAYPSGHATVGTLMGIVLAEMVPEKKAELMGRAWEFGQNRVVAGMHVQSDIEAGRVSGAMIAQVIGTHDDYRTEFEAAKAELRAALGM